MKEKKKQLPFIFGSIKVTDFFIFLNIIEHSDFDYNDIKNFYYFKSRRWDIETKNGLIIKLPSKNLKIAFETLLNILQSKEFVSIKKIDLRQMKQVILDE